MLDGVILATCKALIDDAKLGCTDMVFKDLCIELLAKAKLVLTERQFEEFSNYVAGKLKEKIVLNPKTY
ncbi:MAG: hypothetical protein OEX77_09110 [Candidatus Bathyarchaeota archaeon]|jgi:hypothetical protein|nr:hypothetical protein [Candidatus Bathyarchaeota archaeon]MDH5732841.1 hypothetical protein [Candidatus Bathyarchaeota archaeon]